MSSVDPQKSIIRQNRYVMTGIPHFFDVVNLQMLQIRNSKVDNNTCFLKIKTIFQYLKWYENKTTLDYVCIQLTTISQGTKQINKTMGEKKDAHEKSIIFLISL